MAPRSRANRASSTSRHVPLRFLFAPLLSVLVQQRSIIEVEDTIGNDSRVSFVSSCASCMSCSVYIHKSNVFVRRVLHVQDFDVDRTYEKQVLITNVSYTISALKLVDLTSKLKDFIKLQYASARSVPPLTQHSYQCLIASSVPSAHRTRVRGRVFVALSVLTDPFSINYQLSVLNQQSSIINHSSL